MTDILSLSGTPEQIGYQQGCAIRHTIRAFLDANLAGINNYRAAPLELKTVRKAVSAYDDILQEFVPEISAELDGLAEGAGIERWQAILLQYRREFIGAPPDLGECTTVCIEGEGSAVLLAQNVDLEPALGDHLRLLLLHEKDTERPTAIVLSFAGLLGFLGMNSAGLAVGINYVHSEGWKTGVSPYLLVRQMLKYHTVSECLSFLNSIPISSSRCFTLVDDNSACFVECTPHHIIHRFGRVLHHTNHYLSDLLQPLDAMNPISRSGSKLRLERIRELTDGWTGFEETEKVFEMLSDHSLNPIGLCVHPRGLISRDGTVASVVLKPRKRQFNLRRGHPCSSTTEVYFVDVQAKTVIA